MAQAIAVPTRTGGIPPGTTLRAPIMAGAVAVTADAVTIGAEKVDFSEQLSQIASRLETLAAEQVRKKAPVERRWIANVRAYHGNYDSTQEGKLTVAGQSRAFVKATRSKTVALEARLFDLIFPTDDRNWGIEATPVPKLRKEAQEALGIVQQSVDKANASHQAGDPDAAAQHVATGQDQAQRAQVAQQTIEEASKASDAMQSEMDDQLTESRYPAESRDMIHDACLLGSGVLKGPMVNEATRGRWIKGEGGKFQLEQRADARPMVRRTDPWSFFPDMSAQNIAEAEFTFERYLWTPQDLRRMVKTHSFDKDAVREILRSDRKKVGSATGLAYLTQLRAITGEGEEGALTGRFIGWEYHGPLECAEVVTILRATGDDAAADEYEQRDDPLDELRVVLYFCEGQILKLAPEYPLDSGETLYSVFNVEESEGSIFGYGVPEIMGDSQTALNSAWRMGLDNAALSVGPQAVIDKDAVAPADGSWTMVPKKIWHMIKAGVAGGRQPIEFFNVPNNMGEISKIIEIALQFIDMETGIPMPQQGDQTADQTKTVGGLTILQNAANIIFRRMVKNYDDGIIAPTMRRLYDWNMQFSPRDDIKGDMSIDARGTAVLLLKEVQAQNLMFIVTQLMASPTVAPMLKPYQNVMKLFQAMMIKPSDVMVSEAEYKDAMTKLAQQPPPPDPAQINADSRIKSAQITADSRDKSDQAMLEVARLRENTAMLTLAQQQGLTLQELQTQLESLDKTLQSQERIKAVEIATEDQRAREAKAEGQSEVAAVGQGIG